MFSEYCSFGAKGIDSSLSAPPHDKHVVILEPPERSDAHQKQPLQRIKDAFGAIELFPAYRSTRED
jgi:hypothetical protein